MFKKYFEKFNFYFAKPINEILANIDLTHVIFFKDLQYNDNENEYLKRVYSSNESDKRILCLSEFYSGYKDIRPNVCITNA